MLILNQIRIHEDRAAGKVETSAGGPGLKLYSATRIAMPGAGRTVRFRIVKNSVAAAFAPRDLQWIDGRGFMESP